MLMHAREHMYTVLRVQTNTGSADGPPRVVAILPLSSMCNTAAVRDALIAAYNDVATVAQDVRIVLLVFSSRVRTDVKRAEGSCGN